MGVAAAIEAAEARAWADMYAAAPPEFAESAGWRRARSRCARDQLGCNPSPIFSRTIGARMFISDIEAPSPSRDTPAYSYFDALGFQVPYARTHWKLG